MGQGERRRQGEHTPDWIGLVRYIADTYRLDAQVTARLLRDMGGFIVVAAQDHEGHITIPGFGTFFRKRVNKKGHFGYVVKMRPSRYSTRMEYDE